LLGASLWVIDQADLLLEAWLVFALVVDVRLTWVLVSLASPW
jgi:hypothetical protein